MAVVVRVSTSGELEFIYDDRLRRLMSQGNARTTRASHVEPTGDNRWTADLSPVGGPVLGPFDKRDEALAAEVRWLSKELVR